jgi:DNA-binding MarR family transcriptional regulator
VDGPYYKIETYEAQKSLGYLIKRAYLLMLDCIEPTFVRRGYTFTQWVVMKHLRDGKGMNPKDISHALRHDSGALTRVLDQLESRGLIERHRCREDRRAIELHLTSSGAETVDALLPALIERMNVAVQCFTREEADELVRLLGKLINNVQSNIDSGIDEAAPVGTSAP